MIKLNIIKKKLFKITAGVAPCNKLRITLLRLCGYKIGSDVYIGENLIISDELSSSNNLIIEDRVSIGPRVTVITSSGPNFSKLGVYTKIVRGSVLIKHDSWIGAGAIILPGITIGEGSIVGAGAVVTKKVPSKTVVVGVPAKAIKKIGDKNETQSKTNTKI